MEDWDRRDRVRSVVMLQLPSPLAQNVNLAASESIYESREAWLGRSARGKENGKQTIHGAEI